MTSLQGACKWILQTRAVTWKIVKGGVAYISNSLYKQLFMCDIDQATPNSLHKQLSHHLQRRFLYVFLYIRTSVYFL